MNEVLSEFENLTTALETMKQHYFTLHSDIRSELLEIEASITSILYERRVDNNQFYSSQQSDIKDTPVQKEIPKKSADKKDKVIYGRICNLCHPDKVKKTDPVLIDFMQEAKAALYSNDSTLLNNIYEQVLFYIRNPIEYTSYKEKCSYAIEKRNNPWFEVHKFHIRGDTHNAFFSSRKILSEILAKKRIELNDIKRGAV